MNGSQNPVARKDGLVIQEMPEEVLVYDLGNNKAHCLNQTAAFVWRYCDGVNGVADIVSKFEKQSGNRVDEELVLLAIDQLNERDLLEAGPTHVLNGQSRRDVIKKIGFAAAVAIPLVASIAAPTSVLAAASCACMGAAECAGTACPSTTNCNGMGQCAP